MKIDEVRKSLSVFQTHREAGQSESVILSYITAFVHLSVECIQLQLITTTTGHLQRQCKGTNSSTKLSRDSFIWAGPWKRLSSRSRTKKKAKLKVGYNDRLKKAGRYRRQKIWNSGNKCHLFLVTSIMSQETFPLHLFYCLGLSENQTRQNPTTKTKLIS